MLKSRMQATQLLSLKTGVSPKKNFTKIKIVPEIKWTTAK